MCWWRRPISPGSARSAGCSRPRAPSRGCRAGFTIFLDLYETLAAYKAAVNRINGFRAALARASDIDGDAADRAGRRARAATSRCAGLTLALPDGRAIARVDGSALRAGRERDPDRALGVGQVDAVPRHRRHLAVRLGPGRGAARQDGDAAAAAALHPARHAARGAGLSRRAGRLFRRGDRRGDARRRSRSPGRPARRDGDLDPGAVGRRAAAGGDRARAARPARLAVPRRGDRRARRADGGEGLRACCASGCPGATIVSIGHRRTLLSFHDRHLEMRPNADRTFAPVDVESGGAPAAA